VRRPVQPFLQAGEQVAVVGGVEELDLGVPALVVLLEPVERAERLVADLRVPAVLEQRPDLVAALLDRLLPRVRGEPLHEAALPRRVDLRPLTDRGEADAEQAEIAVPDAFFGVARGPELELRTRADDVFPAERACVQTRKTLPWGGRLGETPARGARAGSRSPGEARAVPLPLLKAAHAGGASPSAPGAWSCTEYKPECFKRFSQRP
jgi:hypothetical protein